MQITSTSNLLPTPLPSHSKLMRKILSFSPPPKTFKPSLPCLFEFSTPSAIHARAQKCTLETVSFRTFEKILEAIQEEVFHSPSSEGIIQSASFLRPVVRTAKAVYLFFNHSFSDIMVGKGHLKNVFFSLNLQSLEISAGNIYPESLQKLAEREIGLLKSVKGEPHIISMIDACSSPTTFLFTEYYPQKDLESWLNDQNTAPPLEILCSLALSIMKGVSALHKKDIVHRDLKPRNIFLKMDEKNQPVAYIGDLEMCCKKGEEEYLRQYHATFDYLPPESILLYPSSFESHLAGDLWALGCTLYFLFSLTHTKTTFQETLFLFHKNKLSLTPKIIEHLLNKHTTSISSTLNHLPAYISSIIQQLLHPQPENRPSSQVCYERLLHKIESPETDNTVRLERYPFRKKRKSLPEEDDFFSLDFPSSPRQIPKKFFSQKQLLPAPYIDPYIDVDEV